MQLWRANTGCPSNLLFSIREQTYPLFLGVGCYIKQIAFYFEKDTLLIFKIVDNLIDIWSIPEIQSSR